MIRRLLFIVAIANLAVACRSEDPDAVLDAAAAKIDAILESSWSRANIHPTAECSDAVFHRRVWFDLAGVAPTVAATREFLADDPGNLSEKGSDPLRPDQQPNELDSRPNGQTPFPMGSKEKRQQLVDRLLDSPQYANHMAARWNEVLLPPDAQSQIEQRANVDALHRWLHDQFYNNVPYDYLVGSFLTAGGAGNSGPAIFYTSHSVVPEKLAAATSRIFLGLQLQCAECHDHPFDRWTQQDFWQFAAFFSQLERDESRGAGNAMIEDRPGRQVMLPGTNQVMSPRYPGIAEPPEKDPRDFRRRQLTIWLASRDNPYFARAAANRAWGHLFGRGIVDPVDAMDANNPPSHPQLLDFLADHLIKLRFDLKRFYATLARTRAYGRDSTIAASEHPPADSFAAMPIKTLTARQYFDTLAQNVFSRSSAPAIGQSSDPASGREAFLARMQSIGSSPQDYPHGVVQVLALMNGPEIQAACTHDRVGLLAALDAPFFDDNDRVETLFLATLSRFPTDAERSRVMEKLNETTESVEKHHLFEDLLWVLLNSAECVMCP